MCHHFQLIMFSIIVLILHLYVYLILKLLHQYEVGGKLGGFCGYYDNQLKNLLSYFNIKENFA